MYHEMKVFGFAIDSLANRPVVLLKGDDGEVTVPIWISQKEAVSMAAELVSREIASQSGRDDLLSALLERVEMKMVAIVFESLHDGMVCAAVLFANGEDEFRVEVRTCEALIASLKYELPVLVSEEVVSQASTIALGDEQIAQENDARRFVDYLEKLDPADLGKYPM